MAVKKLHGDLNKYKLLVQILTSDPRYSKALADVSTPSQHEKLSKCLVGLSYPVGASLSIIYALIQLEFQRKHNHPFTILRVNSIVSKMMGKYTKIIGTKYLDVCLGDLIREIVNTPDLSLEVDPARIRGDNPEDQAQENCKLLHDYCQRFINTITSSEVLDQMPRELRAICRYISVMGETFNLDYTSNIKPLLSGFLMLRYICPAITLPKIAEILPENPPSAVRKNLTCVAKVLQKLANGEQFDTSTTHFMPMNTFIQNNTQTLSNWLDQVIKDPKEDELERPFVDLNKTASFEDLHHKDFEEEDLFYIHSLIYDYGYDLIVSIQNEVMLTEDRRPVSIVSSETEFLKMVNSLGTPPIDEKERKRMERGEEMQNSMKTRTAEENEDLLIENSLANLRRNFDKFDLSDLEKARFMYKGRPAKDGLPVFYIILHRMRFEYLSQTDLLLVHIHKTFGEALESPFHLVIDMSWMDLSEDMVAGLYRSVIGLSRMIRKKTLDNISVVYMVHPTKKSLNAMSEILSLVPSETYNKLVRYAFEWSDLSEVIDVGKIWIPFASKKFVPVLFNVTIDRGAKKGQRIVKLAMDTVMVVEQRSGSVAMEIPYDHITAVNRSSHASIVIQFDSIPSGDSFRKDPGYNLPKSNVQELAFTCFSPPQRELVFESIIDIAILASSKSRTGSFTVMKESRGKRQERLQRFSSDSLLNMSKGGIIKREVAYANIHSFAVDTQNSSKLNVDFIAQGQINSYALESSEINKLRSALLQGIKQYQFLTYSDCEVFMQQGRIPQLRTVFGDTYDQRITESKADVKGLREDIQQLKSKICGEAQDSSATYEEALSRLQQLFNMTQEDAAIVVGMLDREKTRQLTLETIAQGFVWYRKHTAIEKKREAAAEKRKQ
eukprot:gb/GECH01007784.1/.p1 GENE.gb/GECH01007784.1/~~gb/GECH01007784.1/.p1  ORF type:complete len:893 (+),score=239.85 gb/GECH01007784.1/:1-2679(+)